MTTLLIDRTPMELRLGTLGEDGELRRLHHHHAGRPAPRLGDLVRAKAHTHDRRLGGTFYDLGPAGQGFLPTQNKGGGKLPALGTSMILGVRREAIGDKACQLAPGGALRLPSVTARMRDGAVEITPGPLTLPDDLVPEVSERATMLAREAFGPAGAASLGVVEAVPPLVRAVMGLVSSGTAELRVTDPDDAALLRGWFEPVGLSVALYDPLSIRVALDEAEEEALARAAPLPGGGALVFDETEALVAIDVDLGRTPGQSGKGAAERAVSAMFGVLERQAALRALGGQLVVDVPRRAIASPKIVRDRLTRALSHHGKPSVPAVTGEGVCVVVAPRPVPSLLERLTEPHGEGVRPGRRLRADVLAARAYRAAEAALIGDRSARLTLTCPRRAEAVLSPVLGTLTARYGERVTIETTEGDAFDVR